MQVLSIVISLARLAVEKLFSPREKPAATAVPPLERSWLYARITSKKAGSGGAYSWAEILPAANGAFTLGNREGTAFCRNGEPEITEPFQAILTRDGAGTWYFCASERRD
jgi:hypothetical protein